MSNPPPQQNPVPDVEALRGLRRRLESYLATLERNTDSVNKWLQANKDKITLYHRRLVRALDKKDEARAVTLLSEMKDMAGFVLGLEDFDVRAKAAFGDNSRFLKAAAVLPRGLPAHLQAPLPQIDDADIDLIVRVDRQLQAMPEEKKESFWESMTGFLNREKKRQEQKDQETRQQLRTASKDVVDLQSDRHYYIDGFMDYIADTLAPETAGEDAAGRMDLYKNPAYVVTRAREDYESAVQGRAEEVRAFSRRYAGLSAAIDAQDVPAVLEKFRGFFFYQASPDDLLLQKILFEDYQAASVADLALKHFSTREKQAEVLDWSFYYGPTLTFPDAVTPRAIFEKFMHLTLDPAAPLDPKILKKVISTLLTTRKTPPEDLAFPGGGDKNVFQRVVKRFENDLSAQRKVLNALLNGLTGESSDIGNEFGQMQEGLRGKNAPLLKKTLNEIGQRACAPEFSAFWQLCFPEAPLLESLRHAAPDPVKRADLLMQALDAGLLSEIRMDRPGDIEAHRRFWSLMDQDILACRDKVPVEAARRLMAQAFAKPCDLHTLRRWDVVWLRKIATGSQSIAEKTAWCAALLEPFKSDIIKANILAEAANALAGADQKFLLDMEKSLIGDNLRLTPEKVVAHLPQIANVWYTDSSRSLRYTMGGEARLLLDDVSPDMAKEILILLQRRGGFMTEQDGLFRPENIDAIHYDTPRGVRMWWDRKDNALNIDKATVSQLKSRPDFLHVTNPVTGAVSSYNAAAICLLQKVSDDTHLMIDKYGDVTLLKGAVVYPVSPALPRYGEEIHFNAGHAAFLRLYPGKKEVGLTIASTDFDQLTAAQGKREYVLQWPGDADFRALVAVLEKNADIHSLEEAGQTGAYINLKALEYLYYDESLNAFRYKRQDGGSKIGLVRAGAEEAQKVLDVLGRQPGVLRIGDFVTSEDNIDDAYYDRRAGKLRLGIGAESYPVEADRAEAAQVLLQLARNNKFSIIARETDSAISLPLEVARLDRVLLFHIRQGTLTVTTPESSFDVYAQGGDAKNILDAAEEKGRVTAPSLAAALQDLPQISVRLSSFVDSTAPPLLLKKAARWPRALTGDEKKSGASSAFSRAVGVETASYPGLKKPDVPSSQKRPGRRLSF